MIIERIYTKYDAIHQEKKIRYCCDVFHLCLIFHGQENKLVQCASVQYKSIKIGKQNIFVIKLSLIYGFTVSHMIINAIYVFRNN